MYNGIDQSSKIFQVENHIFGRFLNGLQNLNTEEAGTEASSKGKQRIDWNSNTE